MGMQRVIVSMPDELVAAIDKAAATEDRSRSWMIRRAALRAYMPPAAEDEHLYLGPDHEFVPQNRNSLRCEVCGKNTAQHRHPVKR